jgi:hypothetical protein
VSHVKKPPPPVVAFTDKSRAKFLAETVRQTNEPERRVEQRPGFARGARVRPPSG